MNRRKISPEKQTKDVKTARRRPKKSVSLSWRYRLLTLVCGALLISGLFFAARQHFSSIDISIKNSRLRKQSEELIADKRRLLLSKEIALSPSEIKKAAQKIGFTMMPANNVAAFRPASEKTAKPIVSKSDELRQKQIIDSKTREAIKAEKAPPKKALAEKPAGVKIKKGNSSNG